jgi:predicted membrane protein
MRNILIGSVIAIIAAALIIFILESGRSLLQFSVGFLLFIIPITFISSFKSTVMSFILVAFSIFVLYIIFSFGYLDAILGILLAILIGGSIFYLRVNRVQPFLSNEYKNAAMTDREEK